MKNNDYRYFRQSHVILIQNLVFTEFILVIMYQIINISISFILPNLFIINQDANSLINIFSLVYSIFLTLIELILILSITLKWTNEEYEINDGYIIHKRGIVKTTQDIYSLRNLGSSTVFQGYVGRIFNFGTIKLYSPLLKQEFFLTNVHNPQNILKALEDDINSDNDNGVIFRKG